MQDLGRPIFISEIEQLGGAERSLLALSSWLHERGLPHYLLTYADHCDVAQYAAHPVTVKDLKTGTGVRRKVAALKSHFAERTGSLPALASGYQEALHLTLAGVRGFHDLMHDTPSLFGDQERRDLKARVRIAISSAIVGYGLRSGGTTIVTSEYLKGECRKDFGVEAQIVRMGGLATGVEAKVAREIVPGGPLRMLSVCRIEANKRIDWLLRALHTLEQSAEAPLTGRLSELVDWHLDLAGKGSLIAELTQLAQTLGIADRVHFHGFVSDEDLDRLYAAADLFLMPAVQGYGIPAIEALERGLPVLLHRESGVSDILLDTPWATVLSGGEEGAAAALARAIAALLDGGYRNVPRPGLPTEAEWAGRVAELCGWAG